MRTSCHKRHAVPVIAAIPVSYSIRHLPIKPYTAVKKTLPRELANTGTGLKPVPDTFPAGFVQRPRHLTTREKSANSRIGTVSGCEKRLSLTAKQNPADDGNVHESRENRAAGGLSFLFLP